MIELKLTAVDGGVVALLPAQVLAAMQVKAGDTLYLAEMLDGSYRLSAHSEKVLEQIELIEGNMHEEDA